MKIKQFLKIIMVIFLFSINNTMFSQTFVVTKFEMDNNDMDGSTNWVKDLNGNKCALIKIVFKDITIDNLVFNPDGNIFIKVIKNPPSQIWVYVPAQTKRFLISTEQNGSKNYFNFPSGTLYATNTYIMELELNYNNQTIIENNEEKHIFTDMPSFNTVTIGNQIWMADNLNVNVFSNGDLIKEIRDKNEWAQAGVNHQPAWSYYENIEANGVKYGKLYNWYVIEDSRNVCPIGWRVPSKEDWLNLKNYLGSKPGKKLKSTTGWDDINGNNLTGFNAQPSGKRFHGLNDERDFALLGRLASFWSSTFWGDGHWIYTFNLVGFNEKKPIPNKPNYYIIYDSDEILESTTARGEEGVGQSVRCIKNEN